MKTRHFQTNQIKSSFSDQSDQDASFTDQSDQDMSFIDQSDQDTSFTDHAILYKKPPLTFFAYTIS